MHEMSLAESMREIVEDTARTNGATSVTVVRLRIGSLAPVERDALRFCFDVVTKGTVAEGATLEIESVDGTAWCWDCSQSVALAVLGGACPTCGGYRLEVTGGTEMRVHEIELGPTTTETAPCA
jgi:hydrogenase nickel incorporation protein HypA/HybF